VPESTGEVHRLREEVFRIRRAGGDADPALLFQLAWGCWAHQLGAEAAYLAQYTIRQDSVDGGDRDRSVYARALWIAALTVDQRLAEAAEVVDEGEAPPPGSDPSACFQLHLNEGVVMLETNRYEEALDRFRLADAYAHHVDNDELHGVLELNRGAALNSMARYDEAVTAHSRALAFLPTHRHADALLNLANALKGSGRAAEAEQRYHEALELARGNPRVQGSVLSNLAALLMRQKHLDAAESLLRDALELRAEAGDAIGQARSHQLMSGLLAGRGDIRGALHHVARSLELSRGAGVPDDPELVDRAHVLTELQRRLDASPVDDAEMLVQRMLRTRKVEELVELLGPASREVLVEVGSVLEREQRQGPGDGAIEALAGLVRRALEQGTQMAIAEFTAEQTQRNRQVKIAKELLGSATWLERKRYYESEQKTLESEELRRMLPGLAQQPEPLYVPPEQAEALRRLVEACRDEGVDMGFARLPAEYSSDLIDRFVQVGTWRESLALLQAHPAYLLSDEVLRLVEQGMETPDPMRRSRLQTHLDVLRQCREVGPEAACAAAPCGADGPLGTKQVTASWHMGHAEPDSDGPYPELERMAAQAAAHGSEESELLALAFLGKAYLDRTDGDRLRNLEQARRTLSRLLEISRSKLLSLTFSGACVNLGTTLLELSRLKPFDGELLEQARAAFREVLGPSDIRFPATTARSAARGMYETLAALEAADPTLGRRAGFRAERTRSCQVAVDASDALVRSGSVEDYREEFVRMFWACEQLVEDRFAQHRVADALLAAERGRGRGFLAEVGGTGPLPDFVSADLARREEQARSRLAMLRERPTQEDRVDTLVAEQTLVDVYRELARISPELARLRTGDAPTLEELLELRDSLAPGTALLSWFSMRDACIAFALFDDGQLLAEKSPLSWADLESYSRLAAADIWRRPTNPGQPLSPAWANLTEALVPRAWCPRLAQATATVLVPHGLLHELPLHVLPVAGLDGRSLTEIAPVRYLPGLVLGRRLDNRRPYAGSALVLAHSGTDSVEEQDEFLQEACEAAALLDAEAGRVATGTDARIDRITELAPTLSTLHIAAHGFFDPDDPLGSGLLLSDGTQEGTEVLSARTVISRMRLNGAVVVLSGCESNRRDLGPTDEGEGLVRAFLVAGASQVVASQWKVDSATTRRLMRSYYSRVQHGTDVPGALQGAALELRAAPDTSHPYYWGPFVTVGA
jgi:tetratricopeptide (TPR) repeat protein